MGWKLISNYLWELQDVTLGHIAEAKQLDDWPEWSKSIQ